MRLPSTPYIDPRSSAGYLTLMRARALASVYPGGFPTFLPDTVDVGWTGDGSFAHEGVSGYTCTRLGVTNPGGRTGGTPSYAFVTYPAVAWNGKAVMFNCGHDGTGWFALYETESSCHLLSGMLAAGYVVVMTELPNYGSQPTQVTVINGITLTSPKNNHFSPTGIDPPYDPPSTMRLHFDLPIAAANWVWANVAPTKFAIAGHSGGAGTDSYLSCLDSRFCLLQMINPGWEWQGITSPQNPFEDIHNELYAAATNCTMGDLALVAAAVQGRTTIIYTSTLDSQIVPYQGPNWAAQIARVNPWLAANFGASMSLYESIGEEHDITAARTAVIIADLAAHM